jgi:lysophospholipase L1-like esterase
MELLCKDGIHPNEKGHEIMASCLIEYISDFKREAAQGTV